MPTSTRPAPEPRAHCDGQGTARVAGGADPTTQTPGTRSASVAREAVLAERVRISREIHDVLAGSLGVLGIQLQVLHTVLADLGDVDSAVKLLEELQLTTQEGLRETHRAVHALRRDPQPLGEQLAALVDRHRRSLQARASLTIEDEPDWLPPETSQALLRVVGEALLNAAKHAPGQPVSVVLSYRLDEVVVSIANPLGHGEPDRYYRDVDGGYGLLGMRERLLPLEGSVTAGADGDRWVVTARVPSTPHSTAPTGEITPSR
ncbi:hypothetical protein JK358_28515 [Nocardia sp. 2]|uniref:histidine kinase n=1 Tax=Nocardia acididurans TaxID=2802282 RepID=A0ABS1MCJ1_9NOCA|nr:histidine kinase [Nocardia acididurans]MBL1078357.1 hypothetical protein [Nocardia acididurans]